MRLLAWILKDRFGFEQYSKRRGDATPAKRFGFVDESAANLVTKFYRYAGAQQGGRTRGSQDAYEKPVEPVTKPDVDALLRLTRDPKNMDGDYVKVIFATKDSFKGVNAHYVRHLHLLSSMVNYNDLVQLVGRGTRMCGHKALRVTQRKLVVHIYKLTAGRHGCYKSEDVKMFPDCWVFDLAKKRFEDGWRRVERVLMETSVDYELFKTTYNRASMQLHEDLAKTCVLDVPAPVMESIRPFIGDALPKKTKKRKIPATFRNKDVIERKRLRQLEVARRVHDRVPLAKAVSRLAKAMETKWTMRN
jgi:hypothetical protein